MPLPTNLGFLRNLCRRKQVFRLFAALAFAPGAILACAQSSIPPGGSLRTDRVDLPTPINQPPDANDQMLLREQQPQGPAENFAAANAERRKQILEDAAKLAKLAADLKAEIDKTSKDTLSIGVIRKAAEIEVLAHSVKEKMKLTVGAN